MNLRKKMTTNDAKLMTIHYYFKTATHLVSHPTNPYLPF